VGSLTMSIECHVCIGRCEETRRHRRQNAPLRTALAGPGRQNRLSSCGRAASRPCGHCSSGCAGRRRSNSSTCRVVSVASRLAASASAPACRPESNQSMSQDRCR